MSAIQEIKEENTRKLQSEAINRYMMLKETEIELAIDTTERYKSICVGLIISLVLVLSGTGYCLYYIDNIQKCEQVKYVKPNANDKYILERLR